MVTFPIYFRNDAERVVGSTGQSLRVRDGVVLEYEIAVQKEVDENAVAALEIRRPDAGLLDYSIEASLKGMLIAGSGGGSA